jgi:hypothetical protein
MFNDNDNFDEFESNELDPVDKAKLQAQFEEEIENSMRFAYEQIEQMGITDWARLVNFSHEKKIRILENMIEWHASPDREEYEKAAVLKRGLDTIKQKS